MLVENGNLLVRKSFYILWAIIASTAFMIFATGEMERF
jgi:hypothetical protein